MCTTVRGLSHGKRDTDEIHIIMLMSSFGNFCHTVDGRWGERDSCTELARGEGGVRQA